MQVEVPSAVDEKLKGDPLVVYNKDKTCAGFIIKALNKDLYDELIDTVRSKGWKQVCAYFYAFIEKTAVGNNNDTVIQINPSRVLPVESW